MKHYLTKSQTVARCRNANVLAIVNATPPRRLHNLFFRNSLIPLFFIIAFTSCEMMEPPAPPTASAGENQTDIIELGEVTLSASGSSPASADIPIRSYLWEQIGDGPRVTLDNATADIMRFKAPFVHEMLDLGFRLTVIGSNGATATSTVTVTVSPSSNVDADGDGLIEIDTLEMLHNMRYDLTGASYKTSDSATGLTSGCPAAPAGCTGYELTHNLDFDTDGNGTWSGDSASGFMLDPNDNRSPYFVVETDGTGGWEPIGNDPASSNAFVATFEGNGHTISNLAINRDMKYVGFFGATSTGAVIRNIGLINNLANYAGDTSSSTNVGGLAGETIGTKIIATHSTGIAQGTNVVGALVGTQVTSTIVASYATGNVYSVRSGGSNLGGFGALLGVNDGGGGVIASYATGNAYGTALGNEAVGGLIGRQNPNSSVIASYAIGNAYGAVGDADYVGALIGRENGGDVIASYATGTTDGGAGDFDYAGALLGLVVGTTVTTSYGFGMDIGERDDSYKITSESIPADTLGNPPEGVASVTGLTATNAGTEWNATANDTFGAWDFGTTSQAPVLKYADYDGSGSDYSCDMFPDPNNPGGNLCGRIIPGQGR